MPGNKSCHALLAATDAAFLKFSLFQWEAEKKRRQLGPTEAAKAALPGAPAPSASPGVLPDEETKR
jgi:hypothetical protein